MSLVQKIGQIVKIYGRFRFKKRLAFRCIKPKSYSFVVAYLAGAKLPNMTILLPVEKTQIMSPKGKTINIAGR